MLFAVSPALSDALAKGLAEDGGGGDDDAFANGDDKRNGSERRGGSGGGDGRARLSKKKHAGRRSPRTVDDSCGDDGRAPGSRAADSSEGYATIDAARVSRAGESPASATIPTASATDEEEGEEGEDEAVDKRGEALEKAAERRASSAAADTSAGDSGGSERDGGENIVADAVEEGAELATVSKGGGSGRHTGTRAGGSEPARQRTQPRVGRRRGAAAAGRELPGEAEAVSVEQASAAGLRRAGGGRQRHQQGAHDGSGGGGGSRHSEGHSDSEGWLHDAIYKPVPLRMAQAEAEAEPSASMPRQRLSPRHRAKKPAASPRSSSSLPVHTDELDDQEALSPVSSAASLALPSRSAAVLVVSPSPRSPDKAASPRRSMPLPDARNVAPPQRTSEGSDEGGSGVVLSVPVLRSRRRAPRVVITPASAAVVGEPASDATSVIASTVPQEYSAEENDAITATVSMLATAPSLPPAQPPPTHAVPPALPRLCLAPLPPAALAPAGGSVDASLASAPARASRSPPVPRSSISSDDAGEAALLDPSPPPAPSLTSGSSVPIATTRASPAAEGEKARGNVDEAGTAVALAEAGAEIMAVAMPQPPAPPALPLPASVFGRGWSAVVHAAPTSHLLS